MASLSAAPEPPPKKARTDVADDDNEHDDSIDTDDEEAAHEEAFARMKALTIVAASLNKPPPKSVTPTEVVQGYASKCATVREIVMHDEEESGTQSTAGYIITHNRERFVLSIDFLRMLNCYNNFASTSTLYSNVPLGKIAKAMSDSYDEHMNQHPHEDVGPFEEPSVKLVRKAFLDNTEDIKMCRGEDFLLLNRMTQAPQKLNS